MRAASARLQLASIWFYLILLSLFTQVAGAAGGAPIPGGTSPTPTPAATPGFTEGPPSGTIPARFEVGNEGSPVYSMPISLPPGVRDVVPKLYVNYTNTKQGNILGAGFGLNGLSAVTRCPAAPGINGYSREISLDRYDTFCLDGERLLLISGTYGAAGSEYRTVNEDFLRIIAVGSKGNGPSSFQVYRKDGQLLEYGTTVDSQVVPPGDPSVFVWQLARESDLLGNYYRITYATDNSRGESVPQTIEYTGNQTLGVSPPHKVLFEYEVGTLPRSVKLGGRSLQIKYRLSALSVYNDQTLAWRYSFSFKHDPVIQEDQLTQVKLCAPNGTCLPPTTFTWGQSTPVSDLQFQQWPNTADLSPAQGYGDTTSSPIFSGDWNGDGRTDIARCLGTINSCTMTFYIATPSGFQRYTSVAGLFPIRRKGEGTQVADYTIVIGDWNGDGKSDFAQLQDLYVAFYVAQGNGFVPLSLPTGVMLGHKPNCLRGEELCSTFSGTSSLPMVGDWNGDGRSDIARVGSRGVVAYLKTDSGFTQMQTVSEPKSTGSQGQEILVHPVNYPIYVGDWNSDGMTDYAWWNGSYIRIYRATGSGFEFVPAMTNTYFGGRQAYTNPLYVGDWNADGITDIAITRDNVVALYDSNARSLQDYRQIADLSPAQGFSHQDQAPVATGDWNGDGYSDIARLSNTGFEIYTLKGGSGVGRISSPIIAGQSFSTNALTHPIIVGDWNGDGVSDIGRISNGALVAYIHKPMKGSKLVGIKDGYGATLSINYAPLTDGNIHARGTNAAYPKVDFSPAADVVAEVIRKNPLGSLSTTSYRYQGLRVDSLQRSIVGYRSVTSLEQTTGLSTTVTFSQDSETGGMPILTETRLANGTLIEKVENTWTSRRLPVGTYLKFISKRVNTSYDNNGSLLRALTTNTFMDDDGNQIRKELASQDGYSEITEQVFKRDTSAPWLLGLLTRSKVTKVRNSNPPASVRTVAFSYQTGTGLLISEVVEPDQPAISLRKDYLFDGFGNVRKVTQSGAGVAPRVAEFTFDPSGRFKIQEKNALGQASTMQYDPRYGAMVSLRDPNGITKEVKSYDAFGRLSRSQFNDGSEQRMSYLAPDAAGPANAASMTRTLRTGMTAKFEYFDAGGRSLRTAGASLDGRVVNVDKVYDELGRLTHESDPYYTGEAPQWSVTEYDAINRPVRSISPGNRVTSISYAGMKTTTTNPLGQRTVREMDLQGNLISVQDHLGGIIRHAYDAEGQLIRTTDAAGHVTDITYDARGLKTGVVDPATGTNTYQYNIFGEVISQANGNGQETQYVYDALGRLLTRSSADGTDSFTYDTAENGIGQLAYSVSADGILTASVYDVLGRSTAELRRINDRDYVTTMTYDTSGRLGAVQYPSGYGVQYLYHACGVLEKIVEANTNLVLWQAKKLDSNGRIVESVLGNKATTYKTLDTQTGQLTNVRTIGGGGNAGAVLQDLSYTFDLIGNPTQRTNNLTGMREDFTYDGLSRLIASQAGKESPVEVSYDAAGNILQKTDVGTYNYDTHGSNPYAVLGTTGEHPENYTYDAAGNRLSSNGAKYVYTVSGQVKIISGATSTVQYHLDAGDHRSISTTERPGKSPETKLYINPSFEMVTREKRTEQRHYLNAPDGLFALVTLEDGKPGGRRLYIHNDLVTSIDVISDENSFVVERQSFDPWGKRRDADTWGALISAAGNNTDKGFTGHEQLDDFALVHMNGRVYDPALARFISPDPHVQFPDNTQGLNRYSYVLNNPLSYTDPSGYFLKGLFKAIGRFLKKAIPVIVTIAAAYFGGVEMGSFISSAFSAAPQAVVLKAIAVSATQSLIASTASALFQGQGLGDALKGGLKGALIAGTRAFVGLQLQSAFGTWASSVVGVDITSGGLNVIRPDGEFLKQVFGSVVRSAADGAVSQAFGGNFKKGFKAGLLMNLGKFAMEYLAEQEFVAEWNENKDKIMGSGYLDTPEKLKSFLAGNMVSMQVADESGELTGLKNRLGVSIYQWTQVSNNGIPGQGGANFYNEGHPFMSFLSMNIPGMQSVSNYHDFLVGWGERMFGQTSPMVNLLSKSSIPPALYGVTYLAGYREQRDISLIANR